MVSKHIEAEAFKRSLRVLWSPASNVKVRKLSKLGGYTPPAEVGLVVKFTIAGNSAQVDPITS
jgi:hypothetical protein